MHGMFCPFYFVHFCVTRFVRYTDNCRKCKKPYGFHFHINSFTCHCNLFVKVLLTRERKYCSRNISIIIFIIISCRRPSTSQFILYGICRSSLQHSVISSFEFHFSSLTQYTAVVQYSN